MFGQIITYQQGPRNIVLFIAQSLTLVKALEKVRACTIDWYMMFTRVLAELLKASHADFKENWLREKRGLPRPLSTFTIAEILKLTVVIPILHIANLKFIINT